MQLRASYDVVVIGAGHAGLSISYYLTQHGIDHIVLEKGHIGESWRSQRWDTFALNTTNDLNVLPGDSCTYPPDAFPLAHELVHQFESYVKKFALPVAEHAEVISLDRNEKSDTFITIVHHRGVEQKIISNQAVVASGFQNTIACPALASKISSDIVQLHGGDYRNAAQLPEGHVLVVGSAQTGCQIALDLLRAGKNVFLATSNVGRIPRRYRGKDIMHWMFDTGMMHIRPEDVEDPSVFETRAPQVSGVGRYGSTISLQSLHRDGAVILGTLHAADAHTLHLLPNARAHVDLADKVSAQIKSKIDLFIKKTNLDAPPPVTDPEDQPDPEGHCVSERTHLDLKKERITSIIWCTGFGTNYRYIKLPVLNEKGMPVHKEGITAVPGLYFLGLFWQRRRQSALIAGISEDAAFICDQVLQHKSIPTSS